MQQPPIAVEARGLAKFLGGRFVLRHVDLQIMAGDCVALVGENGAGKTTLLRCLAGVDRPTTGEVRWFGLPVGSSLEQRRMIGATGHESRLYPHLTLRENLAFAARMCGLAAPARQAETWLERSGLAESANCPTRHASKGMRQRAALARALVHNPAILLLDEPFSGLDSAGRDWFADELMNRRDDGHAICFSTHDRKQAAQIAGRTISLHGGLLHEWETGVAWRPRDGRTVNAA